MAFRNLSARISGDASSYVSATEHAQQAASHFKSEAASLSGRLQILQGRADEAGDETSALASVSRIASSTIDGLARNAGGLAANLHILQGRADEAEDEIDSAGRSAASTAGLFSSLALSTEGLALSVGSLNTVLSLSLLPTLAALSTALLPLTATVGTLAAALGGLGLGVFAGTAAAAAEHTKLLKDQLKVVASRIQDALEPLADAFLPLLVVVAKNIAEVVEETVALTGGFVDFRNAIWGVISPLFNALPGALATLFEMGRDLLPVLKDFIGYLIENAPAAFNKMRETARDVIPQLIEFGNAIIDALPSLNELGTIILNETLPALSEFFRNVFTKQNLRQFLEFARDMNPIVTAFADIAGVLGDAAGGFNTLNSSLRNSIIAAVLLRLGAVLSGAGGVIALVSGLALAFSELQKKLGNGFPLDKLLTQLKELASMAAQPFLDAGSTLGNLFADALEAAIENPVDVLLRALGISKQQEAAFRVAASELGDTIMDAISGSIDVLGEIMDAIGELPSETLQALTDFGTRIGEAITNAINKAVPNDFSFVLPEQTIDLGPLGKQTIGGDTIKFDIADNPLGGSGPATAASAGTAAASASVPRGRFASDPAGGRGESLPDEIKLSGELRMGDNGELFAVIDDRVKTTVSDQAKQAELQ